MNNLRELKNRIALIRSTRKITSAMRMVSSSRLRQSQEAIIDSSFYAASLGRIIQRLTKTIQLLKEEDISRGLSPRYHLPELITGRNEDKRYLVLVFASSKGLCGSFNLDIAKKTTTFVEHLEKQGRTVRLICIGSKISELLHIKMANKIVATFNTRPSTKDELFDAKEMTMHLISLFEKHTIDACSVVFDHAIASHIQETLICPLFPLKMSPILYAFTKKSPWGFLLENEEGEAIKIKRQNRSHISKRKQRFQRSKSIELNTPKPLYKTLRERRVSEQEELHAPMTNERLLAYDFEPNNPQEMLETLLPDALTAIIYRTFLESTVSENQSRMTAMQSATDNAEDIIEDLTLVYNRTRQTKITNDLTEIISAAETM